MIPLQDKGLPESQLIAMACPSVPGYIVYAEHTKPLNRSKVVPNSDVIQSLLSIYGSLC